MAAEDGATLVVGASGVTGRFLVEQLLERGQQVRAIVRSVESLPARENLSVIVGSLLDFSEAELAEHLKACGAVASCLGHTPTFKGMYGPPRRLVTDATRRLCEAIRANAPETPVRFILMNTAGNSNRDLHEPISYGQRSVMGLIRLLLPPHVDNEQAADYLRTVIGQEDPDIGWAVVRPDTLTDEPQVTEYDAHPSPTRSAIFDPGKTSRINVGHFMADLATDDAVFARWRGQMPIIYNRE